MNRHTRSWLTLGLLLCVALVPTGSQAAPPFPEFVDPNPAAGNQFGVTVVALSTGNVVITSPRDDAGGTDAGAVYLFNGATGALISTLRGSQANDNVGSSGVTALSNGNYVVRSLNWDNGAVTNAGAVTWGSGTSGVSGVVSSSNSLVGSTASDQVGSGVVTALSNGNYVVRSVGWDNGAVADAGAVTWGSGTSGVSGVVSSSNSLVGSTANDLVTSGVTALSNGNYVVISRDWDNGAATDAGAVTWGSGSSGVSGVISSSNSLVGLTSNAALQSVVVADDVNNTFFGRFRDEGSGKVRLGSQVDGLAPNPPTVTTVSPPSGSTVGGTIVTITGTNFTGANAVSFGGTAATGFTVNSATTITATTPTHAAGAVSVEVTTPGGTNAPNTLYTYLAPPTISDVVNQSINRGSATSALAITIGDTETAAADLNMSGTSSNTTLVPHANIVFSGSGTARTVIVTPAADQTGSATITLTVTDGDGSTANDTFVLTVAPIPEISVASRGVVIANNDTTPSSADDTDFGRVIVINTQVSRAHSPSPTLAMPRWASQARRWWNSAARMRVTSK